MSKHTGLMGTLVTLAFAAVAVGTMAYGAISFFGPVISTLTKALS